MTDGFFDVPAGYRDADIEMAGLEARGNEAARVAKKYRAAAAAGDVARLAELADHAYCEGLIQHEREAPEWAARILGVKLVRCSRCKLGPHDDGFPPLYSESEAIDLGWHRGNTGMMCEECCADVVA